MDCKELVPGRSKSFEDAIKRAITSCQQSGNVPDHHFAVAGIPIVSGKGAIQNVPDYQLSRFACYLIAQNGDPRKLQIGKQGCQGVDWRTREK
jgi:DNA-damage-inducible protein D